MLFILIRLHDLMHQFVPDNVSPLQLDNADAGNAAQSPDGIYQTADLAGFKINLRKDRKSVV